MKTKKLIWMVVMLLIASSVTANNIIERGADYNKQKLGGGKYRITYGYNYWDGSEYRPRTELFGSYNGGFRDTTGFTFKLGDGGKYIDVYDKNKKISSFGFGVTGTINGNNEKRTTINYTWNWNNNINSSQASFYGNNQEPQFNWTQKFTFYNSSNPLKIENTLENNLGTNIENTKFWYIQVINKKDSVIFNKTEYQLNNQINLEGNFDNILPQIKFPDYYVFNYKDLIDNGFNITNIYVGNGDIIGADNEWILAVGITKGSGLFAAGTSVDIDPQIYLDYTYDLSDIYYSNGFFNSMIKFNISQVPANSKIKEGTMCLWMKVYDAFGNGVDNDVNISYVSNQTWDEEFIGCSGIDSMTKSDSTITTFSNTGNGVWSCFDVATQLQKSVDNDDTFFTIDFFDPDNGPGSCSSVVDDDGMIMASGAVDFHFEDRENSLSTGNRPALNVTYTTPFSNASLYDVIAEEGSYFLHSNISTSSPYDKMVFYSSFDSNISTTTLHDYTKYNNDGTIQGDAKFTSSGKYGGGFEFDGAGDYIEITDDNSLDITGDLTLSIWVKSDVTTNNPPITKWGSPPNSYMLVQNLGDAGEYRFYIHNGSTADFIENVGAINDGNWHHVAGVYNTTHLMIYVDGSLSNSKTADIDFIQTTAQDLWLGRFGNSYYNGSIDEAMVINRSLTSTQVQDIYNNQSARFKDVGYAVYNRDFTSGNNTINITTDYEALIGSQLNLTLKYYDGSWNNAGTQQVTGQNEFSITDTTTNVSLNYSFYAGSNNGDYNFYSSILKNDPTYITWQKTGDTTPPTFDNLINHSSTVNTSFSYDLDASDDSGIDTFTLNDTTIFSINSSGYIQNITNLSTVKIYWLNVSVNDTVGNTNSGVFYINITGIIETTTTTTNTTLCRYTYYGYYNVKLPFMVESGCVT